MLVMEALSYGAAVLLLYAGFKYLWRSGWPALVLVYVYWAAFIPPPAHFYFENLAAPFTALGITWLLRQQMRRAALAWLAVPAYKEYFALTSIVIGLLIFGRSRRVTGVPLCAAALAGLLLAELVIMPLAQGAATLAHLYVHMFAYLGSSFQEIALNLVTQPQLWIPRWLIPSALLYLAELVSAFALAGLAAPEYLSALLPIVALNVLIDREFAVQEVTSHYSIALLPLCAAAGAVGLLRIREWVRARAPARATAVVLVWLAAMVVLTLPGLNRHIYWLRQSHAALDGLAAHSADVRATITFVPRDASVAATDELMLYFALRADLIHPKNADLQRPQVVVLDTAYEQCVPALLAGAGRAAPPGAAGDCYVTSDWTAQRAAGPEDGDWLMDGYASVFTRGSLEVLRDMRTR